MCVKVPTNEINNLICYSGFHDHVYYAEEEDCYYAEEEWYNNL